MLSPDTLYPLEDTTRGVVFLKNCITNPRIQVGDYTYYDGRDAPERFEKENVIFAVFSSLTIGKFCQIAYGTKFFLSDANHQMSGFSTFPFFIFEKSEPRWKNYEVILSDRGDTVIGNDVWFGHESVVMPGVHVGNGAIIAARAVVTKNVPPYTIVAGNPARQIRKRFPDDVIAQLEHIQWWNWDYQTITKHLSAITGADIHALLKVSQAL